ERNPYRRWFDVLERVLNSVGVSYYRGTACHLTLVQWATNPTWALLPESSREALLERDVPFLAERLAAERIEVVLLNGRSVVGAGATADSPPIAPDCPLPGLFAACREPPYKPGSRGFGQWPRTKYPWAVELTAYPGIIGLKIHRGRAVLVSAAVAERSSTRC